MIDVTKLQSVSDEDDMRFVTELCGEAGLTKRDRRIVLQWLFNGASRPSDRVVRRLVSRLEFEDPEG